MRLTWNKHKPKYHLIIDDTEPLTTMRVLKQIRDDMTENEYLRQKRLYNWLITIIIFVIVAAIFVIIGVFNQQINDAYHTINNFFKNNLTSGLGKSLANIIDKILLLILELIVIFIVYKILVHFIKQVMSTREIRWHYNRSKVQQIQRLKNGLVVTIRVVAIVFAVILVLSLFDVSLTALFASAGILTLALTIGAQGILTDIFAGAAFTLSHEVSVGDIVQINGDTTGTVVATTLRKIILRAEQGEYIYLSNSQIKKLVNYSKNDVANIIVKFEIAYEADLDAVIKLFNANFKTISAKTFSFITKPKVLGSSSLNSSGVELIVQAAVKSADRWKGQRFLYQFIFNTCKNQNIEIPYQKINISPFPNEHKSEN